MYLRRLQLHEFLKPGDQAALYPETLGAFKVCSVSSSEDPADAEIVKWVKNLQKNERSAFRNGMSMLLKLANAGRKLESHYDEKTYHETHSFRHLDNDYVVRRIRASDLRLVVFNGENRIILLTDTFSKRCNKLTQAQKLKAENDIKAFLDAKEIIFTQEKGNEPDETE